ncbi:hypothetical protein FLAG1_10810 [Fusarium langsethiae]|uniref:Tautomerase cis-CaaD-like domain-containing protein n=1 Tax=Fusarium langsethiae TaxID=179993 RepID=A0A0M9EN38_FUSLA|nr:hypothetical protein FLAG1_10810 [Fusarium langsethiae]
MPLWLIFHPPGTFEDTASKRALAEDITKIYTGIGLPPFYVVANFIKLPVADVWVGGEQRSNKPFVRIAIEHIAFHVEKDNAVYDHTWAFELTQTLTHETHAGIPTISTLDLV